MGNLLYSAKAIIWDEANSLLDAADLEMKKNNVFERSQENGFSDTFVNLIF